MGGANLITFTIDGTEYQAEEGMTWGEWINSDYNPGSYFIMDSYVGGLYGCVGLSNVYIEVALTDEIINNGEYAEM